MTAPDVGTAAPDAGTSAPDAGEAAPDAGKAAAPGRPRRGLRLRRWAWPAAVAGLVVLAAAVTALLTPSGNRDALDPRSTAEAGSRAVARILVAHGVSVTVATSAAEAVDGAGAGDTVVVVHPERLGPRQLARLRATPAALVLVEPDLTVLDALAPGVAATGPADTDGTVDPACPDPDATAAGSITRGGSLYRVLPSSGGSDPADPADPAEALFGPPVTCYPAADARDGAGLVRLRTARHPVSVLGASHVLRNRDLPRAGNAALALRLLGAGDAVRWYLPDPLEAGVADRQGLSELLPSWVRWVFWQLVIVIVVVMLWRARRLGRVVTEPLPVVVRSAETVEGRARLYRVSRSRDRAAALLRTATLRRLAGRFGVPVTASPEEVARLVAAATGREEGDVRGVLLGPVPRHDAALVALATALDELERTAGPEARTGR